MKRKRGIKSKPGVPKKGDPDYLTPTQLRNRRKRRARQQRCGGGGVDGIHVVDRTSSSNRIDDVEVDVDVVGGCGWVDRDVVVGVSHRSVDNRRSHVRCGGDDGTGGRRSTSGGGG
ncbi:hypothetical protein ACHAXA_009480 [Cyclostephanos tholiformis]|uniref:Uncharacterized protein n=1 Tax=Cyclostephanos tholiformis TaxID=382380 RepID=A0ABD3RBR0_9STRA